LLKNQVKELCDNKKKEKKEEESIEKMPGKGES